MKGECGCSGASSCKLTTSHPSLPRYHRQTPPPLHHRLTTLPLHDHGTLHGSTSFEKIPVNAFSSQATAALTAPARPAANKRLFIVNSRNMSVSYTRYQALRKSILIPTQSLGTAVMAHEHIHQLCWFFLIFEVAEDHGLRVEDHKSERGNMGRKPGCL